ncbi:MAG: sensor domain-containing protein, partial [Mycobacterium sp.]
MRSDDIPPMLGDVGDLRDTGIGANVTEGQCLGVTSPLEKQTYAAAPVRAVTYSTQTTITFGAVWLASENDAHEVFEGLVDQWRQCDGRT